MRDARVSVRCSAELYDWLRKQAQAIPIRSGRGRRKDEKLSEYVRLILEAHREGRPAEIPQPDPQVIEAGEWFLGLSQAARDVVLVVGSAVDPWAGDRDLEEAARGAFARMAQGSRSRKGHRRRTPRGSETG